MLKFFSAYWGEIISEIVAMFSRLTCIYNTGIPQLHWTVPELPTGFDLFSIRIHGNYHMLFICFIISNYQTISSLSTNNYYENITQCNNYKLRIVLIELQETIKSVY
jgi:hypothetical protein